MKREWTEERNKYVPDEKGACILQCIECEKAWCILKTAMNAALLVYRKMEGLVEQKRWLAVMERGLYTLLTDLYIIL